MTVPSASSDGSSCTRTLKPARSSAARAESTSSPITAGTSTRCGPSENVSVMREPSSTSAPPSGSCAITRSFGSSESAGWVTTEKPASSSVARASSLSWPITAGTSTVGGPLEMNSRTSEPFGANVPSFGDVRIASP
jgi:hypothetical protein